MTSSVLFGVNVSNEIQTRDAGHTLDHGRILRRGPATLDPAIHLLGGDWPETCGGQSAGHLGLSRRTKPLDRFIDGSHASTKHYV